MSRKKEKDPLSYLKKMLALKKAGIKVSPQKVIDDELAPLSTRIGLILGIENKPIKTTEMLYFVMYDIENDKVRTQISKFLIKKGCIRIQKSIFIAKSERVKFHEIHDALKLINELYDNQDSIIMVPVSTDIVSNMKLIGQNVDIDIIVKNKNTLFF